MSLEDTTDLDSVKWTPSIQPFRAKLPREKDRGNRYGSWRTAESRSEKSSHGEKKTVRLSDEPQRNLNQREQPDNSQKSVKGGVDQTGEGQRASGLANKATLKPKKLKISDGDVIATTSAPVPEERKSFEGWKVKKSSKGNDLGGKKKDSRKSDEKEKKRSKDSSKPFWDTKVRVRRPLWARKSVEPDWFKGTGGYLSNTALTHPGWWLGGKVDADDDDEYYGEAGEEGSRSSQVTMWLQGESETSGQWTADVEKEDEDVSKESDEDEEDGQGPGAQPRKTPPFRLKFDTNLSPQELEMVRGFWRAVYRVTQESPEGAAKGPVCRAIDLRKILERSRLKSVGNSTEGKVGEDSGEKLNGIDLLEKLTEHGMDRAALAIMPDYPLMPKPNFSRSKLKMGPIKSCLK